MRTMYDGIDSDAEVIPTDAQLVAGYVDGDYVWSEADWARFPNSIHVGIAVRSTTNNGTVLDCETGDATPVESVNWVLIRRHAGADPSIYCNTSTWPQVRAAFATHDVPEPHYWIAQYDNDPAIPAGAVAKQYQNTARWDLSSVADYWPGVDPAPKPPAPPAAPVLEDEMAQQIEPVQVHPGEMAYDVPKNATVVRFGADGYGGVAKLRVVTWVGDNADVHDALAVGAGARYVVLPLPAGSTHVTVRREDTGAFPVSVGFA